MSMFAKLVASKDGCPHDMLAEFLTLANVSITEHMIMQLPTQSVEFATEEEVKRWFMMRLQQSFNWLISRVEHDPPRASLDSKFPPPSSAKRPRSNDVDEDPIDGTSPGMKPTRCAKRARRHSTRQSKPSDADQGPHSASRGAQQSSHMQSMLSRVHSEAHRTAKEHVLHNRRRTSSGKVDVSETSVEFLRKYVCTYLSLINKHCPPTKEELESLRPYLVGRDGTLRMKRSNQMSLLIRKLMVCSLAAEAFPDGDVRKARPIRMCNPWLVEKFEALVQKNITTRKRNAKGLSEEMYRSYAVKKALKSLFTQTVPKLFPEIFVDRLSRHPNDVNDEVRSLNKTIM